MLGTRLLVSLGGVALAGALAYGATSAWATGPATAAPQGGVHDVYCQTPQFDTYVKVSTPGTMTPGGGPVCYTGNGTTPIDLPGVTRFWSGTHSGSLQYRDQPSLPIIFRSFSPGQSEQFTAPVEVVSLTINS
ncbi:MAG: hypothetical protein ACRDTX_24650 [Pseudonocardiaceae bacterium]